MIGKILSLCQQFESFVKQADLKEDMAKRILFGLAQHLGIQGDAIIKGEDGNDKQVDILALRELVPGAKNLLKYGIRACIDEAVHGNQDLLQPVENNLEEYQHTLSDLIYIFRDQKIWRRHSSYGGEGWAKIAEALMKICNTLINVKEARASQNYDAEGQELLNLMIDINLFEGLMHNTASVLFKMYRNENDKLDYNLYQQKQQQLENLMHSKELRNPQDTLNEVLPNLGLYNSNSGTKAKKTTGLSKYLDRANQYKTELREDEVKRELNFIRANRKIKYSIDQIKYFINKLESILEDEDDILDNNLVNRYINELNFLLSDCHYEVRQNFPELFEKYHATMIDLISRQKELKNIKSLNTNKEKIKRSIEIGKYSVSILEDIAGNNVYK